MTFHLTPDILAAAYELLRVEPPFRGWKLPPADDVEFHVTRSPNDAGECSNGNAIYMSSRLAGRNNTVLETMAHEMIHLHQQRRKLETPNTKHNANFHALAGRVCKHHGFDPKSF